VIRVLPAEQRFDACECSSSSFLSMAWNSAFSIDNRLRAPALISALYMMKQSPPRALALYIAVSAFLSNVSASALASGETLIPTETVMWSACPSIANGSFSALRQRWATVTAVAES
jgi:hypothetical protein